ncbi:hypothetical protein [Nostoc flagelliforme]|uniref:hypothetical protein n=1 Tax=Nostoc flagelliforme TaxID=1306274 RepID=UPI001F54E325|nr:hypothetical protein [Nostoc flagelliforme]
MSKAYPSNLTLAQYEFLSDMIPEPNGAKKSFKLCSVMITGIYSIKESRSKSDRYFL